MKRIMNISKCLCSGRLKLDYCSERPELLLVKPASLAGIAPLIRTHALDGLQDALRSEDVF